MTIHTVNRLPICALFVIGSVVQSLAVFVGHCLARFEAPLARRARIRTGVIVHTNFDFFATTFRTKGCRARPNRRLARHEAVIGSCSVNPGRCSVAPCSRKDALLRSIPTYPQQHFAGHRMRSESHSTTTEVMPEVQFATRRRCTIFLGSLVALVESNDYDAWAPPIRGSATLN